MDSLAPFVPPLPNPSLAELATVVGEDNVRLLVQTFLREFPLSLQQLATQDRRNRQRLAHSMKSSARLVGAHSLSDQLTAFEARLTEESAPDLGPADIAVVTAEFDRIATPLREFATP